jgi:LAGLIDADG DNA endonuclease family
VETHFSRRAAKTPLTHRQRELVVGSLLGDAYLMPTTAGWCFRVNHGLSQREYVDWKYAALANFVRTLPKRCGRCYYFRTVTHPEFAVYRRLFYPDRRKVVPMDLLYEQFTALSLAVWIMDDGAAERKQLRLNTQSFTFEENEALRAFLRAKLGIRCTINRDKDRHRLRISSASVDRLRTLVGPYIIPIMLRKLSP